MMVLATEMGIRYNEQNLVIRRIWSGGVGLVEDDSQISSFEQLHLCCFLRWGRLEKGYALEC